MTSNPGHQRRSHGVVMQEGGVGLDGQPSPTSTPAAGRPSASTSALYSQFQSTESDNR